MIDSMVVRFENGARIRIEEGGDGTVNVECYRPGCDKPLELAIFDHAIRARDMKSDPYGKAWLFLEDCDEDE